MKESLLAKYPADVLDDFWRDCRSGFSGVKRERPRVVIHGGYGKRNMGDDAILGCIIERVEKHFNRPRIVVACHGPDEVERLYPQVDGVSFKSAGMLLAVARADIYVIGGGGIVNRINTFSGFSRFKALDPKGKYLFVAGMAAKLMGAKLVYYGIGATSVPDPVVGALVRLSLDKADAVSVRDPLSKKNIESLGVKREIPVGFDPVTRMSPAPASEAKRLLRKAGVKRSGPKAVLVFRRVPCPAAQDSRFVDTIVELVRGLRAKGFEVVFFPFSRHPHKAVENDLLLARDVGQRLGERTGYHILEGRYRPEQAMAILNEFEVCVAERLHAVIMARTLGKDVFAVSYDNKVEQFCLMSQNPHNFPLSSFRAQEVLDRIHVRGAAERSAK